MLATSLMPVWLAPGRLPNSCSRTACQHSALAWQQVGYNWGKKGRDLLGAILLQIEGEQISHLYYVVNPEKLNWLFAHGAMV